MYALQDCTECSFHVDISGTFQVSLRPRKYIVPFSTSRRATTFVPFFGNLFAHLSLKLPSCLPNRFVVLFSPSSSPLACRYLSLSSFVRSLIWSLFVSLARVSVLRKALVAAQMKMEVDRENRRRPWQESELSSLAKAITKFPAGSQNRELVILLCPSSWLMTAGFCLCDECRMYADRSLFWECLWCFFLAS